MQKLVSIVLLALASLSANATETFDYMSSDKKVLLGLKSASFMSAQAFGLGELPYLNRLSITDSGDVSITLASKQFKNSTVKNSTSFSLINETPTFTFTASF